MSNTNINSVGARLVGVDDPTRDDHAATKGYVDAHGGGGSVSVTDGSTTVTGLTELDFTSGATVTDAGGGVAQVAVAGGGSLPDPFVVTGTDPDAVSALIQGAPDQDSYVLNVLTEDGGDSLLSVQADGAGGAGPAQLAGDGASITLGTGIASLVGATAIKVKPPLAEPDDALLNQFGQVLIWTTNTAGSAKIHFKTLDSDETVVKGTVNLT